MARAYVDGFQTSAADKLIADGWGYTSVNAMIKHWPGGGPRKGAVMHIIPTESMRYTGQ